MDPYSKPRARRRDRFQDACGDLGCDACGDLGCDALDCLTLTGLLSTILTMLTRSVPAVPGAPRGVSGWLWRRVRAYQLHVSAHRPPCCPMTPTCSRYGLDALARHGALRGTLLTVRRLRRCGRTPDRLDPVP